MTVNAEHIIMFLTLEIFCIAHSEFAFQKPVAWPLAMPGQHVRFKEFK